MTLIFFFGGGGGEEVRWKTVRTYGKILATPLERLIQSALHVSYSLKHCSKGRQYVTGLKFVLSKTLYFLWSGINWRCFQVSRKSSLRALLCFIFSRTILCCVALGCVVLYCSNPGWRSLDKNAFRSVKSSQANFAEIKFWNGIDAVVWLGKYWQIKSKPTQVCRQLNAFLGIVCGLPQ